MTPFPFTDATEIRFRAPLPEATDVVIIGGGVIGVASALFLARSGVPVTLLEKGRIAGEQSSRNWGWVRQQGRDAAELPIVIEARHHWMELAQQCGEEIGLRKTGVTYLARTDKQMEEFAAFVSLANDHAVDTRLVEADGVGALIPGMSRRYKGAMTTPSDMRAEPWLAVLALARLASRLGVTIVENCAARILDVAGSRITGVWTEQGRVASSAVLVAGRAWSSLLLRRYGIQIPQLSVRSSVAATEPLPEIHAGAATDEHISFRRRLDGGYTLASGGSSQLYPGPDALRHAFTYLPALRANPFDLRYAPAAPRHYPDAWSTPRLWDADEESPFERMRVLDPAPEAFRLRSVAQIFANLFPQLEDIRLRLCWAGMIDAMPDVVPIVDRVADIQGLVVATGMSGHGFGIGPGIGRVVCDLIRTTPWATICPGSASVASMTAAHSYLDRGYDPAPQVMTAAWKL